MKKRVTAAIVMLVFILTLSLTAFADVMVYTPIVADSFTESSHGAYKVTAGSVSWSEDEKALMLAPSSTIEYTPKAGESGWSGSYSTTIRMKLDNWEETAASNMFILTTKSNASDEKYIFNYKSNGFRIDKMYKPLQYVQLMNSFSGTVNYISDDWNIVKIDNIINDDNTVTIRLYFNDKLITEITDKENVSVNGGITIASNVKKMYIESIEVTEIITKTTVREPDAPAYDTLGGEYEDECLLVRQLGIMQDDENNMFNAGNFMTRKDFAQTIVNFADLHGIAPSKDSASEYNDVSATNPYYPAIYAVTKMGYMKGTGNGAFSPDGTVTIEQAAKVLVSVLGYEYIAEVKGGYPYGYSMVAAQLGLLDSIKGEQNFTRGMCAMLIANALEIPLCEGYEYTADGECSYRQTSNTILGLRDVISGSGILSDNGLTGLVSDADSEENKVVIGNRRFRTGETSAAKYIGYNVKYYAFSEDGYQPRLIYVKPVNNNVTAVLGDDVLPSTTKTMLVYSDENDKEEKMSVSPIADMIYNGKAYPPYDTAMLMPDGDITLIDNNRDHVADVIIVNDYKNMIVEYVSKSSQTVSGLYKNTDKKSLNLKNTDKTVEIYKEGAACDFGKIKANDVLDILESKDGKYVKIIISSEKVSGTVSQFVQSENMYKIGNEFYEFSDYFENAITANDVVRPTLGGEYTFLLNSRGQIVGIGTAADSRYIGFLKVIDTGDGMKTKTRINIFTDRGEWAVYEAADKVKVNGATVDAESVSVSAMNPIFYELNENGKISSIITVTPRTVKDDGLHLDFTGELMYKSSPESFQLEYFPDDAVCFAVPKLAANKHDDTFYSISPQFLNDTTYALELYNIGESAAPEIILWRVEGNDLSINVSGNIMVVEMVMDKLSDGEKRTVVCGLYNGEYQELFVEPSAVYPALNAGDIVQIRLDGKGEITKMSDVLLTVSERAASVDKAYDKNSGTYTANTDSNAANRIVYGKVNYIDSVNKRICLMVDGIKKWVPLSPNGVRYYEVTNERNGGAGVKIASFDDIEYTSKILVKMRYSYPYEVVIYQE